MLEVPEVEDTGWQIPSNKVYDIEIARQVGLIRLLVWKESSAEGWFWTVSLWTGRGTTVIEVNGAPTKETAIAQAEGWTYAYLTKMASCFLTL